MSQTGRLVGASGLFVSVCCGVAHVAVAGERHPPCPKCGRLTIWAQKPGPHLSRGRFAGMSPPHALGDRG